MRNEDYGSKGKSKSPALAVCKYEMGRDAESAVVIAKPALR